MKRWRIRLEADPVVAASVVGRVLAGIGTGQLAASYLAAMQDMLPVTFCTVFAVDAAGRIETVSAASSYGNTAERTAERYVAQRFDLLDPHMTWLAQRPLPKRSAQLWMGHHRGDELADERYRAACYGDVGIRERASVLLLQPTGQRAAISFYRSLSQPDFDDGDFARIEANATLLADATMAHSRCVATMHGAPVQPALASRLLALSLREKEVIAALLGGATAKEAARALGIEPSTARTHQYRAFRRLGIRSLKELLRAGLR